MPLASEIIENIVPISDFSRGKAAQVFEKANSGVPVTVVRNNKPTAVIMSVEEYARLSEAEEDYRLICEALERLERSDGEQGKSLSDVMREHGIAQSDLDAAADIEFE